MATPARTFAARRQVRLRVPDLAADPRDEVGRVVASVGERLAEPLAERRRERVDLPRGRRSRARVGVLRSPESHVSTVHTVIRARRV